MITFPPPENIYRQAEILFVPTRIAITVQSRGRGESNSSTQCSNQQLFLDVQLANAQTHHLIVMNVVSFEILLDQIIKKEQWQATIVLPPLI